MFSCFYVKLLTGRQTDWHRQTHRQTDKRTNAGKLHKLPDRDNEISNTMGETICSCDVTIRSFSW